MSPLYLGKWYPEFGDDQPDRDYQLQLKNLSAQNAVPSTSILESEDIQSELETSSLPVVGQASYIFS